MTGRKPKLTELQHQRLLDAEDTTGGDASAQNYEDTGEHYARRNTDESDTSAEAASYAGASR